MIWKTNLEVEQIESIPIFDGQKSQPLSKVKSTHKIKGSTKLEQQ
jgi:hypothetical protein